VINLDQILAALREIGYKEMVSIELFNPEYWEWEIERTIKTGLEKTQKAIHRFI
jgi:2-keto-myo-inositol isomerase